MKRKPRSRRARRAAAGGAAAGGARRRHNMDPIGWHCSNLLGSHLNFLRTTNMLLFGAEFSRGVFLVLDYCTGECFVCVC